MESSKSNLLTPEIMTFIQFRNEGSNKLINIFGEDHKLCIEDNPTFIRFFTYILPKLQQDNNILIIEGTYDPTKGEILRTCQELFIYNNLDLINSLIRQGKIKIIDSRTNIYSIDYMHLIYNEPDYVFNELKSDVLSILKRKVRNLPENINNFSRREMQAFIANLMDDNYVKLIEDESKTKNVFIFSSKVL